MNIFLQLTVKDCENEHFFYIFFWKKSVFFLQLIGINIFILLIGKNYENQKLLILMLIWKDGEK